MRQLLAIVVLMTLALPAAAAECSTGTVGFDGTSPFIVRDNPAADPAPSVVGQFLWVTPENPATIAFNDVTVAQAPADVTTSVGIPSDAETFATCYGTADVPEAAGHETPAVGGEEVEREPTASQQIIDMDAETYLRLVPLGVHLN